MQVNVSPSHRREEYFYVHDVAHGDRLAPYTCSTFLETDMCENTGNFVHSMNDGCIIDTVVKYDNCPLNLCKNRFEEILYYMYIILYPFCKNSFLGCNFMDLLSQGEVDTTTSPGWPFSNRFNTKEDFLMDPLHLQLLLISDWRKDYVFTSFPKKEIKSAIGANGQPKPVRQICGCPLDYLFHLLPLVHGFNKSIEVSGRGLPFFLGTNFKNDDLRSYVTNFDGFSRGISTDRSSHDSTVSVDRHWFVCELRKKFLPPEQHEKFEYLYSYAGLKYIIETDGEIFETQHGMASGHPCTAHDNSLIIYCDTLAMLRDFGFSFQEIEDNFRFAIYGDDCNIYIRDGFEPGFTPVQIRDWHAYHGITVKCGDCWRESMSLDFLSRIPVDMGNFISVRQERHPKFWASANYSELLSPLDRLMKYVQLRNQSVGTSTFKRLDMLCNEELVKLNSIHGTHPVYLAARRLMVPEDHILKSIGFRVHQSNGEVILKSRPPNFYMNAEKVEIKVQPSSKKSSKKSRRTNGANAPKSRRPRASKKKQIRRGPRVQRSIDSSSGARSSTSAVAAVHDTMRTFFSGGHNSVVVRGRDYLAPCIIQPTSGSDVSLIGKYYMNPGDFAALPKCASLARNYKRWNIIESRIVYAPSCSSTTGGKVLIWADTDPAEPDTLNLRRVMGKALKATNAPWQESGIVLDVGRKALAGKLTPSSFLIQTHAQLLAMEEKDDYAGLRQAIPAFIYLGGTNGTNADVITGDFFWEYSFKFTEFDPKDEDDATWSANTFDPVTVSFSSRELPPFGSTPYHMDNVKGVSGNSFANTNGGMGTALVADEQYGVVSNWVVDSLTAFPVEDQQHLSHQWTIQPLSAVIVREPEDQKKRDLVLEERKKKRERYMAQAINGVDEKGKIYLKDLAEFTPNMIRTVNGVVCYYDAVLQEWVPCPTWEQRQGIRAAGDCTFAGFLIDIAGDVLTTVYDNVVADTGLFGAAADLILDVTGVKDYLFGWTSKYTPVSTEARDCDYDVAAVTDMSTNTSG